MSKFESTPKSRRRHRPRPDDHVCMYCGSPIAHCSECGERIPGGAVTCSNACRQARFRRLNPEKAR